MREIQNQSHWCDVLTSSCGQEKGTDGWVKSETDVSFPGKDDLSSSLVTCWGNVTFCGSVDPYPSEWGV